MKRILLAAAALAAISTGAQANPFDAAYGNTVTQTLPDGTKSIIYVNPDNTWESKTGTQDIKGTYVWKDATHVCFTVTSPAPSDPTKATGCNEITGDHKVGDSWTQTAPDGKTVIKMTLTAGRG